MTPQTPDPRDGPRAAEDAAVKCPCRWLDMPADAEGSCRNCGHGPEVHHEETGCAARAATPAAPEAHPVGPWTGDPADYDGDEGR